MATLSSLAAKIMKPEYWSRISFLAKCSPFIAMLILTVFTLIILCLISLLSICEGHRTQALVRF